MKEIDDDHARLFRALLDRKRRPTGRFSLLVLWLDGDAARARRWLKKHKLASLPIAVLPRDRRDVRAWRLDAGARNTFLATENSTVLGTFRNATAADFAAKMKEATRPGPLVTALLSRLSHHDAAERARAARMLGCMGRAAKAAAPALKRASNDESAAVASAALRALRSVLR